MPLSESVMTTCQLEYREHISGKFNRKFLSRKHPWQCRLQIGDHIMSTYSDPTAYCVLKGTRVDFDVGTEYTKCILLS